MNNGENYTDAEQDWALGDCGYEWESSLCLVSKWCRCTRSDCKILAKTEMTKKKNKKHPTKLKL